MDSGFFFFDTQALRLAVLTAWDQCRTTANNEAVTGNPAFTLADIEQDIRRVFEATLHDAACAHNALQPASAKLPAEILAQTLAQLPVAQRVAASTVCKYWHRVARSSPQIWSKIIFNTGCEPYSIHGVQRVDGVVAMLELSGQSALRLELIIRNSEECMKLLPLVQAALGRCLYLDLFVSELSPTARIAVQHLLSTPAPRLEVLLLINISGYGQIMNVDSTFRLLDGPALRSLELDCDVTVMSWSYTAFRSVRAVSISYTEEPLTMEKLQQVLDVLRFCPDVTISLNTWDDELSQEIINVPEGIQRLQFHAMLDYGAVHAALKRFTNPLSVRESLGVTFSADEEDDGTAARTWRYFLECPSRSEGGPPYRTMDTTIRCAFIFWFYFNSPQHDRVNILTYPIDAEMHTVAPLNPRERINFKTVHGERAVYDYPGVFEPDIFVHVTRLYLSEPAFDPEVLSHELPPLPNLIHLLLSVMPESYHSMDCSDSAFFHTPPSSARKILHCPALRKLSIIAIETEWFGRRPRLTPSMVSFFVRQRLKFSSVRLEQLSLLGVELLVHSLIDFDDVLHIFEHLVCDERMTAWAVNQPLADISHCI